LFVVFFEKTFKNLPLGSTNLLIVVVTLLSKGARCRKIDDDVLKYEFKLQ